MGRVLIVAHVLSMIRQFNIDNIELLKKLGYEVDIACNSKHGSSISTNVANEFMEQLDSWGIDYYQIDFPRSPLRLKHLLKSIRQMRHLLTMRDYDFIHCHGPISSALTRWVSRRKNIPIIYTAHGFHFHKKGSLLNWILFYPIEKYLSRYTSVLITINNEDFQLAKQRFRAKQIFLVNGVGINVERLAETQLTKDQLKEKLGLNKDAFIILSVGELTKNKNHITGIKALSYLNDAKYQYLIAGIGKERCRLITEAKNLNVQDLVHLLGFRKDIAELCHAADVFLFPSYREGLAVAVMEAMAAGLPLVTSKARGVKDLNIDQFTGYTFEAHDFVGMAKAISELAGNKELRLKFSRNCQRLVAEFDIAEIHKIMKKIYESIDSNL